jgi:hypothetical protein
MLDHALTRHAETRMRQRGMRDADLRLVLATATQIAPDAYLLTNADVRREIGQRKREIERLERLRNCKVVVAGESVVTCYPSCPRDQRRTLRKGRARR